MTPPSDTHCGLEGVVNSIATLKTSAYDSDGRPPAYPGNMSLTIDDWDITPLEGGETIACNYYMVFNNSGFNGDARLNDVHKIGLIKDDLTWEDHAYTGLYGFTRKFPVEFTTTASSIKSLIPTISDGDRGYCIGTNYTSVYNYPPTNTPPNVLKQGYYATGDNPTGVWEGHPHSQAYYNEYFGTWSFSSLSTHSRIRTRGGAYWVLMQDGWVRAGRGFTIFEYDEATDACIVSSDQESDTTLKETYGVAQTGDYLGEWIWNELYRAYKVMYRFMRRVWRRSLYGIYLPLYDLYGGRSDDTVVHSSKSAAVSSGLANAEEGTFTTRYFDRVLQISIGTNEDDGEWTASFQYAKSEVCIDPETDVLWFLQDGDPSQMTGTLKIWGMPSAESSYDYTTLGLNLIQNRFNLLNTTSFNGFDDTDMVRIPLDDLDINILPSESDFPTDTGKYGLIECSDCYIELVLTREFD